MSNNRNRLVAPRNVVNTKMLYTFYILKELAKGETLSLIHIFTTVTARG